MVHHDDHSDDGMMHDEHEHDAEEWIQLLSPEDRREVQELERAKCEVERQVIHANQAKLAGRRDALRGSRRAGGSGAIGPAGGHTQDVMSHLYAEDVDVDRLAALLPKPGEGEKAKQLPFQRLWDGIAGARFSPWYAVLSMVVTLVASCVYLYETTLDAASDESGGGNSWTRKAGVYPSWYAPLEDFFLAFFCFDVLMGAVMADHDWGYWLATETIVEILSLLPSLLFVAFDLRLWGFLRFVRVLRWSDIATVEARRPRYLRLSEMDGTLKSSGDKSEGSFWGLKYESLSAAYKLTAFVLRFILVLAGAAVLLDRAEGGIEDISADNPDEPLSFASALYMSAMLLTTVGEGGSGPVPVSNFARIVAAFVVVVFLPLAAIRLSDVVKHADTSGTLDKGRRSAPAVRERHVVALGSITDANISARLKEIFHVDHGKHNTRWVRAVVVSPNPPSHGIRSLLETSVYRGRVSYIQGSALDDDCLRKAGVSDAAAVMVLANKLARSSHVEDMNVSLQAISVMTHVELQRRQGWGPRLLVELLDPNAAIHLRAAGVKQVLSSDQLKLSVLAQSCLCPGWSAVVTNLLESRAALPPKVLEQGSWLAEYYVGAKKTFYSVEFSPNFAGMLFENAVVYIFELFELILVAVESRRAGVGDPVVLVNPSGGYRIGRGDRAFVLAESQADARVVWDYMAKTSTADEFTRASRFMNPEEEEASALETLGTAGIASMGPQAFVDSMMYSRTLLQCQRRLPEGEAPDPGVIIEWARQFQVTEGLTNLEIVNRILSLSGLTLLPPTEETASIYLELGIHPDSDAPPAATTDADTDNNDNDNDYEMQEPQQPRENESAAAGTEGEKDMYVGNGEKKGVDVDVDVVPPPVVERRTGAEAIASTVDAAAEAAEEMSVEDIMKTLKTMEVSSLDGETACERLLHLQAAAEIATQPKATFSEEFPKSTGNSRRIPSARDWKGHVVVVGFPARPSHVECFLRPLKGWSGGTDSEGGGRGVPVVMMAKKVDMLESALEAVEKAGQINTREVYLLEGSPVSHMDLENAGVRNAKVVLVMKDPRRRGIVETDNDDDALRDAEALVTFMKMEDGLLTQGQHVVVELESSANVRFMHTRSEASSLQSIAGLGGAGRGGPADDAHYLWPKYAAGMTYNAAFLDSLFGQAFYRPSRLALIERLLLLDRGDFVDTSQANHSIHRRRRQAASLAQQDRDVEEGVVAEEAARIPETGRMVREASLMQMGVPSTFLGHSFGELFQHLASPPLRCVAFALLRARGTRNAPEPYVYTGPRADTVLHAGDRIFVLGCPPAI